MIEIDIPVHPAAAAFPMLSDDELADLAEDIKANGLRHPIVLGPDGAIRDGRNRYVACRMAGVEPEYTPHDGDVAALIFTENVKRRHMSQGQLALAVAQVRLETNQASQREAARLSGVTQGRIGQAETILAYAGDLAPGIMAGIEKFDKAYATALARKRAREDEAEAGARKAVEDRIRLERLTRSHPDIAALVPEQLTLDAAEAAGAEVSRRRAAEVEAQSRLMETVLNALDPGSRATPPEKAGVIVGRLDATSLAVRPDFTPQRIARARDTLAALVVLLEAQEVLDGRSLEPVQR